MNNDITVWLTIDSIIAGLETNLHAVHGKENVRGNVDGKGKRKGRYFRSLVPDRGCKVEVVERTSRIVSTLKLTIIP